MMKAVILSPNSEDTDIFSFLLRKMGLTITTPSYNQPLPESIFTNNIDLFLITVPSPEDAFSFASKIRHYSQSPMLLLIDPIPESVHCDLLDEGFDLVLFRPFSSRLLTRYAKLLLGRLRSVPATLLTTLQINSVLLNPKTRTVTISGFPPQQLTQLEFRLLYTLMTNAGQIMTTEHIVERVWGYTGEGNKDLVRGLIRRLRRKLEPNPDSPRQIENIPGVGYTFLQQ